MLYLLGAITPFVLWVGYRMVLDTHKLYRTVIKYGGEDPRVLNPVGRVVQRVLQSLTGRQRAN